MRVCVSFADSEEGCSFLVVEEKTGCPYACFRAREKLKIKGFSLAASHYVSLNAGPEDAGPEPRFRGTQKHRKSSEPNSSEGKSMPMSPQLSREHFHNEEFSKKWNPGKFKVHG